MNNHLNKSANSEIFDVAIFVFLLDLELKNKDVLKILKETSLKKFTNAYSYMPLGSHLLWIFPPYSLCFVFYNESGIQVNLLL